MPAQRGAEWRSENRLAMAGQLALRIHDRTFELVDQTRTGGRDPLEMPPRVLEVAERIADRFDLFKPTETGTHEVPCRKSRLPPGSFALFPFGPRGQPCEKQRAHRKRKCGVENSSKGPQTSPPRRVEDLLIAVMVVQNVFAQEQV